MNIKKLNCFAINTETQVLAPISKNDNHHPAGIVGTAVHPS